jgi:hypothetical protein
MIIQILMAAGAIACTAAVAKFIWQEKSCINEVFKQIKEEIYGER